MSGSQASSGISPSSAGSAAQDSARQKNITVLGAVALYVASVLGGGILVLPGLTAAIAGPGALIAWVSVSIVCLPIALMFAKLSAVIPDAGGVSTFVRQAYGNLAGDITGWLYLWIIPVGQPAVVLSGLYYAKFALHLSKNVTFLCAWLILAGAAALNIRGTRISVRAQSVVSISVVLILIFTVIVSVPHASAAEFQPVLPRGAWAIGSAAALIMWAYVGWENVSFIAEDFRNPRRDFVLSMSLSVVIVGGLYTLVTAAVLWVVPRSRLDSTTAPLAAVLTRAVAPWTAGVAAALSVLIITGSAMAFIWGGSSLAASLARSGSLPPPLAERNSRGSFRNSVLVLIGSHTVTLTVLYMGWLDLNGAASIVGVSAVSTYALCAIAYPRLVRPATLIAWLPPVFTLTFCLFLLPFFGISLLYPAVVITVYFVTSIARRMGNHARNG